VAIGIIILLVALLVTASTALVRRGEARRTESILQILDGAVKEWEKASERKITFGIDGQPFVGATYEMKNTTPHAFTVTEVARVLSRNEASKTMLSSIPAEHLYYYDTSGAKPAWIAVIDPTDPDPAAAGATGIWNSNDLNGQPLTGSLAVTDAWGVPIRAVHAGPTDQGFAGARDADGSLRLSIANGWYGVENFYGVATSRQMLFVSAGPDGRFGSLDPAASAALQDDAADNVYSYAVTRP